MRKPFPAALLALVLLACGLASPTLAGTVDLAWDQTWLQVPFNTSSELAIMMTDSLDLRTIEVTVEYDPTIVQGVTVRPGAIFDPVPCFLWETYEEDIPGLWHGFVVIMGGDCWTSGPGELLVWEFRTLGRTGVTPVTTVEAVLFEPDATRIPGVNLSSAVISVGSPAADIPEAGSGMALSLHPNPFNPRVGIRIDLARAGPVAISVYDVQGRLVAVLNRRELPAGSSRIDWDGRNGRGIEEPAGLYFFSARGPDGETSVVKGVLVR